MGFIQARPLVKTILEPRAVRPLETLQYKIQTPPKKTNFGPTSPLISQPPKTQEKALKTWLRAKATYFLLQGLLRARRPNETLLAASHYVHAVVGLKEGHEGHSATETLVPLHLEFLWGGELGGGGG